MNLELRKEIAICISEWLEWANDGPEQRPYLFCKYAGLCGNVVDNMNPDLEHVARQIMDELKQMFSEDGLDVQYPFNNGAGGFLHDMPTYTNPLRVEWAKKIVQQYGEVK